jgi:hypothetical protein
MKKKFKVGINRYYFVTDYIEVEANDVNEAKEKALELSDNKDYTGNLSFDYATSEVIENS